MALFHHQWRYWMAFVRLSIMSGIAWLESLLQQQGRAESTAGDVTAGDATLTPNLVTASAPELTPESVTAPKPKRAYKPRARRCACGCGQMVTPTPQHPNKRFYDDACRQRARRAKMAEQRKADSKPSEDRRTLCLCLWCGVDFLADPTKRPKYHQTGSCKEYAYRQRRHSAIDTVATVRGYSYERAEALVKHEGMPKVSRWLQRQGWAYNEAGRAWVMAVEQGSVFVHSGGR
jgi:hypothetical protein